MPRLRLICLVAILPCVITAQETPALRPRLGRLAYYERPAPGPAIVLIPGSWNDHRIFDAYIRHLDPRLRIIIVELPGHGRSQPPSPSPSIARFADDVLSVIDTLKIRSFYAGGHSIGGMIAIEMAGRRPRSVLGVISMEGWTHHQAQADAFPGDRGTPLTPREIEQRERNRGRLSQRDIDAFASAWRKWDGSPILETTPVPVLELWGDRGRPRPSRARLRIPERANITFEWMAGSGHALLVHRPVECAQATNRFIASNMFTGESDLARLPRLISERFVIHRAIEGRNQFNMHPYIAWFDGRFRAMWSTNRIRDLQPGQYVRFATSADGVHWSEPSALTPSEEQANWRYFARGFWIRDGRLIALAARDEAVRPLFGPGLTLLGYRWNSGFEPPIEIARDAINNFPPRLTPDGQWLMSRRDHRMSVSMLKGAADSPSSWTSVTIPPSGTNLDEPEWWTAAGGTLIAAFRDGARSRRLYRSVSRDSGQTWTPPVRTNFPDATAKFNVLRLSSGLYAMASNPNPSGVRIPLALSLSRDGIVFQTMAILRDEDTTYRYGGKDPGYRGYHYPQLLEHRGFLYLVYAENMEDIVISRLPLASLAGLMR